MHKKQRAEYGVGYGKPPAHSRFKKGRSGSSSNPSASNATNDFDFFGRPFRLPAAAASAADSPVGVGATPSPPQHLIA
jgi:hypothetical protein